MFVCVKRYHIQSKTTKESKFYLGICKISSMNGVTYPIEKDISQGQGLKLKSLVYIGVRGKNCCNSLGILGSLQAHEINPNFRTLEIYCLEQGPLKLTTLYSLKRFTFYLGGYSISRENIKGQSIHL